MSSFGVVVDTCCLYPATLSNLLLWAAHAGMYRLHWSAHILEELERNLAKRVGERAAARRISTMRQQFAEADVTGYESLIKAMKNHPKDRHVVAAAIRAGAQVIVTSNMRDFPSEALAPHGLEAQTPDEFLLHLYDLQSDLLTALVGRIANGLNNPAMTVDEFLRNLDSHAPRFVKRVLDSLSVIEPALPNN